jgi:hypothetical protein
MTDRTDEVSLIKKLEEIFWNGRIFVDKNGCRVKLEPISNPVSIPLFCLEKELKKKKVEEYINECIPKTSTEYWEANAYCEGTSGNNEFGTPVQFYKIR